MQLQLSISLTGSWDIDDKLDDKESKEEKSWQYYSFMPVRCYVLNHKFE